MVDDPEIPLLKQSPLKSLRDWAAIELPHMAGDGLKLEALVTEDRGASIRGQVQYKDVSGAVVWRKDVSGERSLAGVVEWRF